MPAALGHFVFRRDLLASVAFALSLCGLAAGPSLADDVAAGIENPSLTARWVFSAGATLASSDAEVSSFVKGTGVGGSVDLSMLGVDEDYVSPFFALRYRPSSRWRWDFSYQNLRLDGERGATNQIDFGNITIPVGWNVSSDLKADFYSATVGYSFYRTPNAELGGFLGLSVLDFSANIEGRLNIGNSAQRQAAGISEVLPVPMLGLFGTYAFNNRVSVEGKVQYLTGSYADYSGDLFIATAALNYWIMPNTAATIGYKYLDANVKYDGDSTRDSYQVSFGGPFVMLSIGF